DFSSSIIQLIYDFSSSIIQLIYSLSIFIFFNLINQLFNLTSFLINVDLLLSNNLDGNF
ncbi:hypothetical protein ACJX0J_020362, partial [Zea mays]